MDIVITFVDGLDPLWRSDFQTFADGREPQRRFRDWGTLKYLLRGIHTNMPFVRKVHLVVSRDSQVPSWIDRNNVHVVLHSDIIPEQYLPTFNSTTIEMFLYRIEDLDEQFVYFNDDIIPLLPMRAEDFYIGSKALDGIKRGRLATNDYKCHCRNSSNLARRVAGLPPSKTYIRAQHTASPMLRSACEELFDKASQTILGTLSKTRNSSNLCQYVFLDYMFFTGRLCCRRQSCKHFSLAAASGRKIARWIQSPGKKMVCINDVDMSEERFEKTRKLISEALEGRLCQKSRFEL